MYESQVLCYQMEMKIHLPPLKNVLDKTLVHEHCMKKYRVRLDKPVILFQACYMYIHVGNMNNLSSTPPAVHTQSEPLYIVVESRKT